MFAGRVDQSFRLFVAVGNTAPLEVVGSQLNLDPITWKGPDVVHPHLAGDMSQYVVAIFQFDTEHGIGQRLQHRALHHNRVFLGLRQGHTPGCTLLVKYFNSERPGHTVGVPDDHGHT